MPPERTNLKSDNSEQEEYEKDNFEKGTAETKIVLKQNNPKTGNAETYKSEKGQF